MPCETARGPRRKVVSQHRDPRPHADAREKQAVCPHKYVWRFRVALNVCVYMYIYIYIYMCVRESGLSTRKTIPVKSVMCNTVEKPK